MKPRHLLLTLALLPLLACARGDGQSARPAPAAAAVTTAAATTAADPRIALAAKIPGASVEDLRATPVAGVYELTHGADISYVSADGKFLFAGDLYQIADNGNFPNLSESRRRELRLKLVNAVPESQMLVFGPQTAKHTLTVFTDVDCAWCRRLHSQINDYNKAGIRVRYMFFPRTGPDTESWEKAEQVWCSADRKAALTTAKLGKPLTAKVCGETPVAGQYALGRELGVSGTPGLVLETGELVPGYLPPAQLKAYLDDPVGHPIR
ncbi:MAG: DsbC family protein [Steroidobacteraceae bacterium]